MARTNGDDSVAFLYTPRNQSQKRVAELWPKCQVIFLRGGPGTGKTAAAVGEAVKEALDPDGHCRKILLSRPSVYIGGRGHGFIKGDLEEKLGPWMAPFRDIAETTVMCRSDPWASLQGLLKKQNREIEMMPLELARGRTVRYATLLLDEGQNASFEELKCLLTRIGDHGRVVISGDPDQSDIKGRIPLADVIARVKRFAEVGVVDFKQSECMRSPLVSKMARVLAYDAD